MQTPSNADLAPKTKNLRRIAAGIINGKKRRSWDELDRQRLREHRVCQCGITLARGDSSDLGDGPALQILFQQLPLV